MSEPDPRETWVHHFSEEDGPSLATLLGARGIAAQVSWCLETGSTNDDVKHALATPASAPLVMLAERQTSGRGRGGAAWLADAHSALLLSVGLRPDLEPDRVAPITLAVGERVARVVGALARGRVCVKWPNDVEVGGKKVAGILVEAQSRGARLASIVVGVGLNVSTTSFPGELAATATSLALLGVEPLPRVELAGRIIAAIVDAVGTYEREGLAPFLPSLRSRDALLGRRVRIDGIEGVASGVDDAGRLLVRSDNGSTQGVLSGHVERLA